MGLWRNWGAAMCDNPTAACAPTAVEAHTAADVTSPLQPFIPPSATGRLQYAALIPPSATGRLHYAAAPRLKYSSSRSYLECPSSRYGGVQVDA
jgi:hypothetical protein